MSGHSVRIVVAGEELELFAERAAYWRARATLLIADPHFGKAASFRHAGLFVPEATTRGALDRIDLLLQNTEARRVVFLGDFLHAREGRHPETLAALNAWRARHSGVAMTVVRGNHDRHAGDPPAELRMTCVDAPLRDGPFAFTHHPRSVEGAYALAGHVHPAVRLVGRGRQRVCLPCFHFSDDRGVLPAFGEFTGVAAVEPKNGDRVYAVTDDGVHAITA